MVLHTSIVNWRRQGWGQHAMGICTFYSIWNLCGVMVFQTSMLDWRRVGGLICHGCMCILLYMKCIRCNDFPEIYAQLEEGGMGSVCTGICPFFSLWNIIGVVVFHRSMVNWRRGCGQSAMSICAFFYI